MSSGKKAVFLITLILILDQALKIWVKTNMVIGEDIPLLGKKGMLHFIENNGMALGMEIGGKTGKLFLSIFRIAAIFAIGWFLNSIIRKKASTGLILAVSAIFAGAVGNMIDSAFYGMIFSESYHQPALMFPPGGGYSSFLHGRVVDMFYFPVYHTVLPSWFPFWGGEDFEFFRPIFNFSDACISCGVLYLIIFQYRFFSTSKPKKEKAEES